MKEIKGSVMINVPAEKVWATITDFSSYPEWNPFVTRMEGELRLGSAFDVVVTLPERDDIKYRSTLVKMEKDKELQFKGKIRSLLSEEHSKFIEQIEESKCMFSQSIAFKGFLTLFAGKIIKDSQVGLNKMNEELKKRCEMK
ncbi:MAG: SRPBCC domain-containing protein [Methanomassiliicoccales archaeon]|nr:SRPBCC domain-containing protein [Methanomassiliicoccales archaeon]